VNEEKRQKLFANLQASSRQRNEGWKKGIEEGYISPDARKQWIAEHDACATCLALNGMTIGIQEEFPHGDPPLHPHDPPRQIICRCTVDMVDEDVSDFENMTWDEIDAELDSLFGEGKKKKKKIVIDAEADTFPSEGKKKKKKYFL
jgi:hypothetical protein